MHLSLTDAELRKYCESDCRELAYVSALGDSFVTVLRPTWHRLRVRVHDESKLQDCWRWMMPNRVFVEVLAPQEDLVDRNCIVGLFGMEEMGLEATVDEELGEKRKWVKQRHNMF